MNIISKFFSNTRKPEGLFGRIMVNGMNGGGHAKLAEWGLREVSIAENANILDVGCGGGANIARLLHRSPRSRVTGIDYSPVSVKKSRKVNAKAIANGRCKVVEGSAEVLPFDDASFELVTAFETVYFWPEIEKCFAGIRRVLKDDGLFVIVNEDDGLSGNNEKWEKMIEGMHTYTPDELRTHLTTAGFHNIIIRRDEQRHWLCVSVMK